MIGCFKVYPHSCIMYIHITRINKLYFFNIVYKVISLCSIGHDIKYYASGSALSLHNCTTCRPNRIGISRFTV